MKDNELPPEAFVLSETTLYIVGELLSGLVHCKIVGEILSGGTFVRDSI